LGKIFISHDILYCTCSVHVNIYCFYRKTVINSFCT